LKANRTNSLRQLLAACLVGGAALTVGCNLEMRDDSRLKPYEGSPIFKDGRSSRPLVPGTVAHRADAAPSTELLTGMTAEGQPTAALPMPITPELLETGRKNYEIYCSMCHGHTGYADGMVVKRGFPLPPSYHIERLRRAPVGHVYDVITNGYGVMYSYADRIPTAEERWAVAAYVKTLQYSQYVPEAELTPEDRSRMNAQPAAEAPHAPAAH
jgi:mono/diheme cytochrome c family protein